MISDDSVDEVRHVWGFGDNVAPNAVIGDHFSLYDNGDELNDGEILSLNLVKMNGRVGNHLTGLSFIKNLPKEAGGADQDGDDAFGLYCETSGLKSHENWTNVEKPKINKNGWRAVEIAALSLFNTMQNPTSDLCYVRYCLQAPRTIGAPPRPPHPPFLIRRCLG